MRNPLDWLAARLFRKPVDYWPLLKRPLTFVTYDARMHHIVGRPHYNANVDPFNEGVADGEAEFVNRYLTDEGFRG